MRYPHNCPARPEYFDPSKPVFHMDPPNHFGLDIAKIPAECLWAQLRWEQTRGGSPDYLLNLETEWSRRNLCSRCLRDLDHPFMTDVDDLRRRMEEAERKIEAIRGAAMLPDQAWRMAVASILEPVEGVAPDAD